MCSHYSSNIVAFDATYTIQIFGGILFDAIAY